MVEKYEDDAAGGVIGRILRKIPGFGGYLDKEARRASDQQARLMVADFLERGKRGLDAYARELTEAGKLDAVMQCDRLRAEADLLIARLRGAPSGYSSFFELVQVDEDLLEDVYEHDLWMMDEAQRVAEQMESLAASDKSPAAFDGVKSAVAALQDKMDERVRLLTRAAELD